MSMSKPVNELSRRLQPPCSHGRRIIAIAWLVGMATIGTQWVTPAYCGSNPPTRQPGKPSVYLIVLGGARKGVSVGCGDRLVVDGTRVPRTLKDVRASLERLTRLPAEPDGPGSYYNALGRSRLRVAELRMQGGVLHLHLNGQLVMGGMCDGPRIAAQLERTAGQLPASKRVCIDLNGRPLDSALSLREGRIYVQKQTNEG